MIMKNGQKGFTLIEVAVAFAVLALVSGTLLQMFIVSAKVNHQAYEIDKANALAVKIQEVFKENPSQIDVTGFAELVGASKTPNGTTTAISAYLDKDWQATTTTVSAFYHVDLLVATTGTSILENSGYYPSNGQIWHLNPGIYSYDLLIDQDVVIANQLLVQLPGGLPVGQIPLAKGIPIIIDNNGVPINNLTTIKVTNSSATPVSIYILDASSTTAVAVNVVQGVCNYSVLPSELQEVKNQIIELTITRMSDGMLLATSTGSTYGSTP